MTTDFDASAGLNGLLGIEFVEIDEARVEATMPVEARHRQPLGYLHGGASVAFAETVASVGATRHLLPDRVAFGLEINANHIRPVKSGILRATADRLHAGRTTQVWQVEIRDDQGRLVCVSRCTLAVVRAERDAADVE